MKMQFIAALCVMLLAGASARAVDVVVSVSPSEAFLLGTPVTFTATATNTNSATIYTWHFDDGTPDVAVTGDNVITHTFTKEELFAVTVLVNNGVDPVANDFIICEGIRAPNPLVDPKGIDLDDPDLKKVTNPDNGISFELEQSYAGFIQGNLSQSTTSAADRAGGSFSTDFGDGVDSRNGNILQHRYELAGVYVMTNTLSEGGSETGKLRKTLAFNEVEMGGKFTDPNVAGLSLTERKIKFKSMKGKMGLGGQPKIRAAKQTNDTLSVSWGMMLPAGFDLETQIIDLAIGNVLESIPLGKNGKGQITQPSSYKSVKFKFPKPDKGETFSSKPFKSQVTVQMSASNLTGKGFDTEGITNLERKKTGQKGPFMRKIQVATMFAGETYAGAATVEMNVSKDDAFGSITGRSSK